MPCSFRFRVAALILFAYIFIFPCEQFAQNSGLSELISPQTDSLERALEAYRRERPQVIDIKIVQMLNALGNEYSTRNLVKALEYSEQARKAAQQLGDKQGQADALRILGAVYYKQGNYDNAVHNYFDALKIYEEIDAKSNIARTWNELGITYALRSNYRQALESYHKALQIYTLIGNKSGYANTLSNLADLYLEQDSTEQAIRYFKEAISIWQELGDMRAIAPTLNGMGLLYLSEGLFPEALESLHKAEELLLMKTPPDKPMLGLLYTNIALGYMGQKKYNDAKRYLNQALTIAQDLRSKSLLQVCYFTLTDFYAEQGNYKLALEYSRLDNQLKDTIFNEKSDNRVANAEARYELVQKQRSIEKNERDLQVQEQKIQLQNQRFVFLAIGFVLVAAVVILLANGYRNKQKAAAELQLKNAELEAANNEIEQKNEHLEELNNEKNEFFGIVAHDLKNPILSIKLLAQLLHDQNELPVSERQRFTNTIISSSDQMSRIISNLLNVNAIERGAMTLNYTAFNISVAAYSVFEEYEARASAKNVALHFDSFSDADCFGDQTAVMQIMENIVSNAIKYSPAGKNVWIRIHGEREWTKNVAQEVHPKTSQQCVRIEVQDEGPGLSDDDKKKLFGKFMRLSAKPTSGEQSTGLGLSIVKKMVLSLGGNVWCESTYGKGATFIVELPQAD